MVSGNHSPCDIKLVAIGYRVQRVVGRVSRSGSMKKGSDINSKASALLVWGGEPLGSGGPEEGAPKSRRIAHVWPVRGAKAGSYRTDSM